MSFTVVVRDGLSVQMRQHTQRWHDDSTGYRVPCFEGIVHVELAVVLF